MWKQIIFSATAEGHLGKSLLVIVQLSLKPSAILNDSYNQVHPTRI